MFLIFCCFGWKFCYGFFPPAKPNRLQCKIPPIQQSTDDSWRTEKVFAMEAASAGLVRARWPQNDWVGTCRSIACMVQPCRCKSHICMRLHDLNQNNKHTSSRVHLQQNLLGDSQQLLLLLWLFRFRVRFPSHLENCKIIQSNHMMNLKLM